MIPQVGDWVQAKTSRSELIHGFVESVDLLHDIVDIFVVASDNEKTIGKTVKLSNKWVKSLPAAATEERESVKSLIDIALQTRDEDWLRELVSKLGSSRVSSAKDQTVIASAPRNRIQSIL